MSKLSDCQENNFFVVTAQPASLARVVEVANYNTTLRKTHKPVNLGSYWGHKLWILWKNMTPIVNICAFFSPLDCNFNKAATLFSRRYISNSWYQRSHQLVDWWNPGPYSTYRPPYQTSKALLSNNNALNLGQNTRSNILCLFMSRIHMKNVICWMPWGYKYCVYQTTKAKNIRIEAEDFSYVLEERCVCCSLQVV